MARSIPISLLYSALFNYYLFRMVDRPCITDLGICGIVAEYFTRCLPFSLHLGNYNKIV